MTPKEIALQLSDAYFDLIYNKEGSTDRQYANYIASKAVDHMLNDFMLDDSKYATIRYNFMLQVKQEIEKL